MTEPLPDYDAQAPSARRPLSSPRPAPRGLGKASVGQRIAGALLVLNALLLILTASLTSLLPPAATLKPGWFLGSAGLDLVIGLALLLGYRRFASVAMARALLGLIVFAVLYAVSQPINAVFQVLASTGLLLLLVAEAGRFRLVAGAVVFGVYLALSALSLTFAVTGQMPLATWALRASKAIEPIPSTTLSGAAANYSLSTPAKGWYLRSDALAKKDNPLVDRWLICPQRDAHLMIVAEQVAGGVVPLESYTEEVLQNAKRAASRFEVKSQSRVGSQPGRGRLVRVSAKVKGLELEYLFGVFAAYDRGFQLVAFAPVKGFEQVQADLESMINSFQLPPEALNPPPPPDVEASPAGRVTGVAYPYTLEAPSDRWHLRKAEAARKDNALIDRWLVRYELDAHVFVLAEHVPGARLPLEDYVDAVLKNLATRSTEVKILSREPLARDPEHARLVHLEAKVEGKPVEYWYALYVAPERGFQVAGFAAKALFPSVGEELRQAVESFRLPAASKKP